MCLCVCVCHLMTWNTPYFSLSLSFCLVTPKWPQAKLLKKRSSVVVVLQQESKVKTKNQKKIKWKRLRGCSNSRRSYDLDDTTTTTTMRWWSGNSDRPNNTVTFHWLPFGCAPSLRGCGQRFLLLTTNPGKRPCCWCFCCLCYPLQVHNSQWQRRRVEKSTVLCLCSFCCSSGKSLKMQECVRVFGVNLVCRASRVAWLLAVAVAVAIAVAVAFVTTACPTYIYTISHFIHFLSTVLWPAVLLRIVNTSPNVSLCFCFALLFNFCLASHFNNCLHWLLYGDVFVVVVVPTCRQHCADCSQHLRFAANVALLQLQRATSEIRFSTYCGCCHRKKAQGDSNINKCRDSDSCVWIIIRVECHSFIPIFFCLLSQRLL